MNCASSMASCTPQAMCCMHREKLIYSPKELMEMDWLDECVDGALPHYDDLDVKTRTLVAINGLANLKKLE